MSKDKQKLKEEIVKGIAFDIEKERTPGRKDLYHFEAKTWPITGHIWASNKDKALESFEEQMIDSDVLKKKAEQLTQVA